MISSAVITSLLIPEFCYLFTVHIHHYLIRCGIGLTIIINGLIIYIHRMSAANDHHNTCDNEQE